MSMGGGGGGQMPMASNRGQQQQRMGQMPQGGMFGQGGTSMMTNQPPGMMGGQIAPMQVGQQVGGGSNPYAQQVMALEAQRLAQQAQQMPPQGGMQGMQDRMAGIGALGGMNYTALGGMNYTGGSRDFDETGGGGFNRYPPQIDPNTGYPVGGQTPQQGMTKQQIFEMYGGLDRGPGVTMIDDSGMFRPRIGTQGPGDGLAPRGYYPINDGNVMPPGAGYPPPTNTTMPLPRRRPDNVLVSKPPGDLPGRGMPPGYGPTKGPIDGRKLRDMIDIRTRRPVDGLPNALENNLPPSLKRPTQNRRG